MKNILLSVFLFSLLGVSGCSSLFNPYHSEFICPDAGPEVCPSMNQAYENAKSGTSAKDSETQMIVTPYFKKTYKYVTNPMAFINNTRSKMLVFSYERVTKKRKLPKEDPKVIYEKGKYETLGKLLTEKEIPVVAQAKRLKILVFPYTSGDQSEVLNGSRYVFLRVEDPQWVFDPMEVD